MYRGIVLGDLWGIEKADWLILWSGLLGAIVSASVAAVVAILVLTRSNRHQQRLVEKQLAEQRLESAMVREKAAMADVLAAATQFLDFGNAERVLERAAGMRSAVYRWALESNEKDRTNQLLRCVAIFNMAGLPATKIDSSDWGEWLDIVIELNRAVVRFGMDWYAVNHQDRLIVAGHLVRCMYEMEKRIEDLQETAA